VLNHYRQNKKDIYVKEICQFQSTDLDKLELGVKCIDLRDKNVAASSLGTQSTRAQPGLRHNTAGKKTAAQQAETSEMKETIAEHRERVGIKPIPGIGVSTNT